MTRERFICTDCSETAPGRSSLGTSVGRIAPIAGALSAFTTPMASTQRKIAVRDGWLDGRETGKPERQQHLHDLHGDEVAAAVHHVGDHAADLTEEQERSELREVQEPDVARVLRRRVRELARAARSASRCRRSTRIVPPHTSRKSRWRSAACAVPRRSARSPSTIASVATFASGSGFDERRNSMTPGPYETARRRRPEFTAPGVRVTEFALVRRSSPGWHR